MVIHLGFYYIKVSFFHFGVWSRKVYIMSKINYIMSHCDNNKWWWRKNMKTMYVAGAVAGAMVAASTWCMSAGL